jgi:two-component system sensor histidine kinase KdpD
MKKFLITTTNKSKQYIYSIVAVILVSTICFGLSNLLGYRMAALVLLLTVSLLAILFDIFPVLLAALLSAFIWDFFFIPPRFTIHVDTAEDSILLIMYFVIASINGVLTYKIRQVEKASRLKEERASSVKLYNTVLNSLSHELRTPIAAIIGATDNLQLNKNLSEENKVQFINEISKASLRLNQQVENLLNISRLESGHIKPKNDWCDVVELIYEVTRKVEENTSTGRKINIHVNQNIPLCYLDKGMLDQILYNLLNNAVIHSRGECRVDLIASCHSDLLEIIVEDAGDGFHDMDKKDVFEKFSRTKTSGRDRPGLGLSIVKGFTEALGGNIELEKGNYGGAKFIFTLTIKTSYIKTEYE